jgi:ribosomal protein L11 methyltransferase
MFYAFSRFHKPQVYAAARSGVLTWAKTPELLVFLETEKSAQLTGLEKRTLTENELARLENLVDSAWQNVGYGGYSAGYNWADVNGFCYFELDEAQLRARLVGLIVGPESDPTAPLQANTLQLALTDLLREVPSVEQIFLPFPVIEEDKAVMAGHSLEPDGRTGLWRVVYEGEEAATEAAPEVEDEEESAASQSWLELSVKAEPEAVEAITELFARYGYNQGVVIEEAVEPGPDGGALRDATAPVVVRTYIPADNKAKAGIEKLREGLFYLGKLRHIEELQVSERREEDWANAWKEFYQVHRVGRRTVIKPPWQEYAALPDDIVVEIDPGMAFGTGLHPTTRLCLQLMEDQLDPAWHKKALDLGTGSGILAIAAAKLGIPYILGLDTDAVAIRAARENVERNGLSDKVQMETGSLAVEKNESGEGGFYAFAEEDQRPPEVLAGLLPFDAIIANIIARVLIALAEPMAAALRPGGLLITSGIIAERADEVAAALEQAGLELVERREENDWVAFAHTRR